MSTVKNALKGGAVAGVGLFGVAVLIAFALLPLLVAGTWYVGALSFEAAAIMLLIIACYSGGDSSE